MIGHALLMFTEAQEDLMLTTAMSPRKGPDGEYAPGPCLLMTAARAHPEGLKLPWRGEVCWGLNLALHVGLRYDELCHRFGCARVNNAIRNRILSNRAYRALTNSPRASRDTPFVGVGRS